MLGAEMMLKSLFQNLGVDPEQIANLATEVQEKLSMIPQIQSDISYIKDQVRKIRAAQGDTQNE